MKATKVKKGEKTRVVKSWRLKPATVKAIKGMAKNRKCSESEMIEESVEIANLWLESHPHVENVEKGQVTSLLK